MGQTRDDPPRTPRPNLREFDAYADRNAQDFGQDEARDVGRPAELQRAMRARRRELLPMRRRPEAPTGRDSKIRTRE
jgi:hypothetical protein